jgi:hypothetical protein
MDPETPEKKENGTRKRKIRCKHISPAGLPHKPLAKLKERTYIACDPFDQYSRHQHFRESCTKHRYGAVSWWLDRITTLAFLDRADYRCCPWRDRVLFSWH